MASRGMPLLRKARPSSSKVRGPSVGSGVVGQMSQVRFAGGRHGSAIIARVASRRAVTASDARRSSSSGHRRPPGRARGHPEVGIDDRRSPRRTRMRTLRSTRRSPTGQDIRVNRPRPPPERLLRRTRPRPQGPATTARSSSSLTRMATDDRRTDPEVSRRTAPTTAACSSGRRRPPGPREAIQGRRGSR